MKTATYRRCMLGLAALALSAGAGFADPPAKEEPPPTPPASPPRSLDDLLGIGGAGKEAPPEKESDDPALERARERVRRALDEREVEGLLKEVLSGMRSSATRLSEKENRERSIGLATQRVQQEVIDKLDILIDQAQRRRQQSRSQSSQSSSSDRDGEQTPGESTSRDGARETGPEGAVLDPPPPEHPSEFDRLLEESGSEWGMLPARVREMIRQGRRDGTASIYQRLTEEYYRRMAEDASR